MNSNEVQQNIQELETLQKQTFRFRLITLIALLAIIVTGVSTIVTSAYSLAADKDKQKEFLGQFNERLHRDVVPVVQKVAGRSLNRLKPAVEAELRRLNDRAPEITDAAVLELEVLAGELTVKGEQMLDRAVGDTLRSREDKIRKMHPGLYDKQVSPLLDNMKLEVEDQLAKSGEKLFNSHLNSIQSILANLEKIQKTEKVDPKKEADAWQVAFLFLDVFVNEFNDLSAEKTMIAKESQP